MNEEIKPILQDFESNEEPESLENIFGDLGFRLPGSSGGGAGIKESLDRMEKSQEDLKADFKEFKTNNREDFKDLKTDFKDILKGVKTDFKDALNGLKTEHATDSEKASKNFYKLVTSILSSAVIAVMILIYVLDGDSDNIDKSIARTNDNIETLSNQLDKLDDKLDKLDDKINTQDDKLDDKFNKLDDKLDDKFNQIIDRLNKN